MDKDPNWAKILDPDKDPNSMYLDPQQCFLHKDWQTFPKHQDLIVRRVFLAMPTSRLS